ncbi:cell division protein FtsQ/DivIB [Desulfothermobacter acidiphilus]|uniref:cell division protein FtsQ/DivIB n=1 Tax=Desulfothermobacter acidiphilus TaxID=1938353 RepID=UPI003F8A532B
MLAVSTRRKKNNRRYRWERLGFILLLLLVIYLLLNSSWFTIEKVRVEGNKNLTAKEILEAAKVPLGENIFRANLETVAQRVAALPQIAEARVYRRLPHTVLIHVRERELVALMPGPDGFYGLDLSGHCIGRYPVDLPFPVLTGIGEAPPPGQVISHPGFAILEKWLGALKRAALLGKIAEMHMASEDTVDAYTTEGVKLYLGGPEQIAEKIDLLIRLLPVLEGGGVEYVNLEVASRPVVRFKGGDRRSAYTQSQPAPGGLVPGTNRGRANAADPGNSSVGAYPAH